MIALPSARWRSEVAPGVTTLLFGVLALLPISFVIFTSVQSGGHFALEHWLELGSPHSALALLNTIRIGLVVSVLSVAGAMLLAWLVTRTDLPWRSPIAALIPLPLL